jgi:hypothetical protein
LRLLSATDQSGARPGGFPEISFALAPAPAKPQENLLPGKGNLDGGGTSAPNECMNEKFTRARKDPWPEKFEKMVQNRLDSPSPATSVSARPFKIF